LRGGKRNLNFIDVETINKDNKDDDIEHYERILHDYEQDMLEIK
jgi:hypothetical protein